MVTFYRTPPAVDPNLSKYHFSVEMFPDIDNQATRVRGDVSNGFATESQNKNVQYGLDRNNFIFHYFVDGRREISFKSIRIVLTWDGGTQEYNTLDDPDVIRVGFVSEDGGDHRHIVACLFDEFPADHMTYSVELVKSNGPTTVLESGEIDIVLAPWEQKDWIPES